MANYRRPQEEYCCSPDPEPRPEERKKERFPVTVLSCGTGAGLSLPVGPIVSGAPSQTVGNGYGAPTLVVGTVSLDSRGLDHPDVKIDFSSLINFRAISCYNGFEIQIIFQLSRSCDHGPKIPLANWIFEREVDVGLGGIALADGIKIDVEFKDPFSFVWCECHDCPGCCTYLVEILDIFAYDIESLSITNVGISAIASGQPRD